MTWSDDAAALLVALVRSPSPSGGESDAAALLAGWAVGKIGSAEVDDAAVRLVVEGCEPGPTLLFASHLDTVPPGEGWSCDPYEGKVAEGWLTARGAVDAKASVAAMAVAAARLAAAGGPGRGRLVVLATYSEETRDTTMPEALRRLGSPPHAAVIGEPTGLEPCIAQRGQLLLRLIWTGEQLHAGWVAGREPRPVNAIERAAADLLQISGLSLPLRHQSLGAVAFTPTMLSAGVARNVTPPRCEAVLDIRTTPSYGHDEVIAAVRATVAAEVEVISDRLVPAETPAGSALLAALRRVRPQALPFASPTCSDWVFLRGVDAVKLGPGDSRQSHRPDERIALDEVCRAAELYAELAVEVLA